MTPNKMAIPGIKYDNLTQLTLVPKLTVDDIQDFVRVKLTFYF